MQRFLNEPSLTIHKPASLIVVVVLDSGGRWHFVLRKNTWFSGPDVYDLLNNVDVGNYDQPYYIEKEGLHINFILEVEDEEDSAELRTPECRIDPIDQFSTTITATPLHTPLVPSTTKPSTYIHKCLLGQGGVAT